MNAWLDGLDGSAGGRGQMFGSHTLHDLFLTQTIRTISNTAHEQCLNFFTTELPDFFLFAFYFFLAVHFHQSVGILRSFSPMSPLPPTDAKHYTLCVVRALTPPFGRAASACVSSPRDWIVSVGSHMQQDMDMSEAPPRPGAPLPRLRTFTSEISSSKLAIFCPET